MVEEDMGTGLRLRDYSLEDIAKIQEGRKLVTALILYRMPDYKLLLQSFIWQEYDFVPAFPGLNRFLRFWEEKLEGPLHSVSVMRHEGPPYDYRFPGSTQTMQ